uniref:CSON007164 protein n=1 Tax=Culicoides sonorensis TaxID=179676 RepID=A0A336LWP0_CULSO
MLRKKSFLINLSLMADILGELKLLSEALQKNNISIVDADYYINRTINCLLHLKNNQGKYESAANNQKLLESSCFAQTNDHLFDKSKLIDGTIKSLKLRMFSNGLNDKSYTNLLDIFMILDETKLPTDVANPWKKGEEKLEELSKILRLKIEINDFHKNFLYVVI